MTKELTIASLIVGFVWVIVAVLKRTLDQEKVSLKECPHTGEKTLVNVSSACNCETVHTVCDDCGQILKVDVEC